MSEGNLLFDPNSNDPFTRERGQCLLYDCTVKKVHNVYQECQNRVLGKSYTLETCEEEIRDLVKALDHCAGHKAFKQLK